MTLPDSPAARRAAAATAGAHGPASDQQLTEWVAAALEADGRDIDADGGSRLPDLQDIMALAAAALEEHSATHPAGTMGLWPGPCYDLVTVDRPDLGRVCLLALAEGAEGFAQGLSTRRALAALLGIARTAAARIDSPDQDDAAMPGRYVPEAGTVLAYHDEESAWLVLGDLVHDLHAGEASDLNNAGLLAQIAYLVQRMGPDGVQAALHGVATAG